MPNHITTVLRSTPEVVAALLDENQRVDFNRIIPAPENIEQSPCTGHHAEGVVCWYRWNVDHWGTKWNAYEVDYNEADPGTVTFQTAWSMPLPVIEALAKRFPEAAIDVEYADEDYGSNVGRLHASEGEVSLQELTGTREGRELAAHLLYDSTPEEVEAEWAAEEAEYEAKYAARMAEAAEQG